MLYVRVIYCYDYDYYCWVVWFVFFREKKRSNNKYCLYLRLFSFRFIRSDSVVFSIIVCCSFITLYIVSCLLFCLIFFLCKHSRCKLIIPHLFLHIMFGVIDYSIQYLSIFLIFIYFQRNSIFEKKIQPKWK